MVEVTIILPEVRVLAKFFKIFTTPGLGVLLVGLLLGNLPSVYKGPGIRVGALIWQMLVVAERPLALKRKSKQMVRSEQKNKLPAVF